MQGGNNNNYIRDIPILLHDGSVVLRRNKNRNTDEAKRYSEIIVDVNGDDNGLIREKRTKYEGFNVFNIYQE